MPTGDQMRRPPAHAGRLPPWERLAIALVLLAMAGFIIMIVIPAGGQHPPSPKASSRHTPAPAVAGEGATPSGLLPAPAAWENQRLAAALAPVLRGGRSLAVGVVDGRAGGTYGGDRVFHAASIVRADILAALLLQRQRAGTAMTGPQRDLAAKMIENGDAAAAAALWNAIGRAAGLATANRLLRLGHTTPGDTWQLTSTTVDDQLWLLTDLTSPGSPLLPASRSYELGLLRHVEAPWGITAAAAPGSSPAVADGSLLDGGAAWVTDSIGVIFGHGRQTLIAVLSDGQPTEDAGIDQVEAAVRAAVSAVGTPGAHPGRGSE
jgi:hypothetical protein